MANESPKGPEIVPTRETYEEFQRVYELLNWELFEGRLPNCLITLVRRRCAYGYFSGSRFSRPDGQSADEIALNPLYFRYRDPEDVLSTLAHEMVHLWQHHFGKPGRGRYHNKEWAEKMREIGLQPSDTGAEGGKETGDCVSHYIIRGGAFDLTVKDLLAGGFNITWTEECRFLLVGQADGGGEEGEGEGETTKSGKRVKYTCPECKLNAWARHNASLVCGAHNAPMEPARTKRKLAN